jgi:hypothetical protein
VVTRSPSPGLEPVQGYIGTSPGHRGSGSGAVLPASWPSILAKFLLAYLQYSHFFSSSMVCVLACRYQAYVPRPDLPESISLGQSPRRLYIALKIHYDCSMASDPPFTFGKSIQNIFHLEFMTRCSFNQSQRCVFFLACCSTSMSYSDISSFKSCEMPILFLQTFYPLAEMQLPTQNGFST